MSRGGEAEFVYCSLCGIRELLHQAERCKASLSKTHIDLVDLKAGASGASVDSVIITLQKTIERAKEVQAELKKTG